jgi:hypothetical protein
VKRSIWIVGSGAALILAGTVSYSLVNDGGATVKARHVDGQRAGGLERYDPWNTAAGLRKGQKLALGVVKIRNRTKDAALIEYAVPVTDSSYIKTTNCRIWSTSFHIPANMRGKTGVPMIDSVGGWPPKGYPIVKRLPQRNTTVAGHSTAELPFAVWTSAPEGVEGAVTDIKIVFRQNGKRYVWMLPVSVKIRRCENGKATCPQSKSKQERPEPGETLPAGRNARVEARRRENRWR